MTFRARLRTLFSMSLGQEIKAPSGKHYKPLTEAVAGIYFLQQRYSQKMFGFFQCTELHGEAESPRVSLICGQLSGRSSPPSHPQDDTGDWLFSTSSNPR